MKLTVAVAAFICSANAFACQKGLNIETFTNDQCKHPRKTQLRPTEAELKQQCVPKVKKDDAKLAEAKDKADAAESRIEEHKQFKTVFAAMISDLEQELLEDQNMLTKISDLRKMQKKTHEAEQAYKAEQQNAIETEAASQQNVKDLEEAIATADQKITDTKDAFKKKDEEFKQAVADENEAKEASEATPDDEDLKTAYADAKQKTTDAELAVNTATEDIQLAKDAKAQAIEAHHNAKDTHDATDFKKKEKELQAAWETAEENEKPYRGVLHITKENGKTTEVYQNEVEKDKLKIKELQADIVKIDDDIPQLEQNHAALVQAYADVYASMHTYTSFSCDPNGLQVNVFTNADDCTGTPIQQKVNNWNECKVGINGVYYKVNVANDNFLKVNSFNKLSVNAPTDPALADDKGKDQDKDKKDDKKDDKKKKGTNDDTPDTHKDKTGAMAVKAASVALLALIGSQF